MSSEGKKKMMTKTLTSLLRQGLPFWLRRHCEALKGRHRAQECCGNLLAMKGSPRPPTMQGQP